MRKQVVANTGATADVLGISPFFKNNTVIPTVIGQFFIPFNLSTLPLYTNAATIVGIVFLLAILYIAFDYSLHKNWAVLMGLLWFFLFAIPPTIYRLDNADTFFNYLEHRTYLPMIGIVIMLAFFLDTKLDKPKFNKYFLWAYMPLLVIFAVLAFMHCADYKNNYTLASRAAALNNPSGLSMRAGNYMDKKDTVNALADINAAIEMSPKDPNMFFIRGKIRAKMMQHESAEQDFSAALVLNPNLVDAYMARSVERRMLKKYEGAFRDIHDASRLDSTNPRIYFSFGNLFVATENYVDAVNSFSKAIKLKKDYAEAYNNRAYAKIFTKDFKGAIDDGITAKSFMPSNPYVYNNIGQAYRELSQLDSAFTSFNKAIELDNNFAQAYFERGKAHQQKNDKTAACKDFSDALKLGNAEAKLLLDKNCK
jgi:tetratricopeptide (TPR) repeat protein